MMMAMKSVTHALTLPAAGARVNRRSIGPKARPQEGRGSEPSEPLVREVAIACDDGGGAPKHLIAGHPTEGAPVTAVASIVSQDEELPSWNADRAEVRPAARSEGCVLFLHEAAVDEQAPSLHLDEIAFHGDDAFQEDGAE